MGTDNYQMLAKTFAGLEEVLKTELEEIGATNVETVVRGVKFTGTTELLYKANFCSRISLRILRTLGEFTIKNPTDLYDSVYSIKWEDYFDISQTFAVNSTVNSDSFNNSMFVSLKSKDAIVDRFRSIYKKRPSVNTETPDININIHASKDTLTVSLDSSGESLHKRGYRVGQNDASMNEVLAAGILKMAGWKGQTDFYDTMCGSGTIPIEAALIARNIPPGIFRPSFAFENWKDFDQELFEEVYNDDYEIDFDKNIFASDISTISLNVAEKNAKSAGVLKTIKFKQCDFASFEPETKGGLLIINPPYGERMNERAVEPIYAMIGTQLKHRFAGFKTWVFSSSEEGFRNIGLRPSVRIPMYNGALECSFRLFEVYEGSKKDDRQEGLRRSSFTDQGRKDGFNSNSSNRENRPRRRDDDRAPRREDDRKPKRWDNDRGPRGDNDRGPKREGFSRPNSSESFGGGRRSDSFRPDGDRPARRRDDSGSDYKGERKPFPRKNSFHPRVKHDDFKPGANNLTPDEIEKMKQKPKRPRIKGGNSKSE